MIARIRERALPAALPAGRPRPGLGRVRTRARGAPAPAQGAL